MKAVLLLLIAVAGCCCWLLLLIVAVDCCCWLLLLVAAVDCCCWLLLLVAGCFLIAAGILLAGWLLLAVASRKTFEYFRDFDDLQLRQFCRRKSLWIFSKRLRRNLAKTSFKNIWEHFEEAMRKFGKDKFWICFKIFSEQELGSRNTMRWKWKRVLPRGIRLVDCRKANE